MADAHAHDEHVSVEAYKKVFIVLLVCTAISFVTNWILGHGAVGGFVIIITVAVVKAFLVVAYFMHLIIDWKKVFILIVPTLILAPLLVVALWPDIVLASRVLAGGGHP